MHRPTCVILWATDVKLCFPFQMVEYTGFKKLLSILAPNYSLPSRKTIKAMVEAKFKSEKEKAKEKVKKATAVALTMDMWTSINVDSYLAFTCHYVDEDYQLSTTLLAVGKFSERHTAANIAATTDKLLSDWGIARGKVMCLTTDGAPNMPLCSKMLQFRHSHCIAHALNLVVKKAIQLTPG